MIQSPRNIASTQAYRIRQCALAGLLLLPGPVHAEANKAPIPKELVAEAFVERIATGLLEEQKESIYMRVSNEYRSHFVFVEPSENSEFRTWAVTIAGASPTRIESHGIWARSIAELTADELRYSDATGIEVAFGEVVNTPPRTVSDLSVPERFKFRYYLQSGRLIPTIRFEFPPPAVTHLEQVLRIAIPLSDGEFGTESELRRWSQLESELAQALVDSGAGQLGKTDIGDGIYNIFCRGANADDMLSVAQPILQAARLPEGSAAIVPGGNGGFAFKRVPL